MTPVGPVRLPLRLQFILGLNALVVLFVRGLQGLGVQLPIRLSNKLASRALVARLMPSALGLLARGRTIVLITGSNGKTSTTAMLAAALGGAVATNSGNRNCFEGLLDVLLCSDESTVVLETDELWLVEVLRWLTPSLLVVLNLVEDSWACSPDPQYVLRRWRRAVEGRCFPVLAWGDSPALVGLFQGWPADQLHWICQAPLPADQEALLEACPNCGGVLARRAWHWTCRCGLEHPAAATRTSHVWRLTPGAKELAPPVVIGGQPLAVSCGLPGQINRRNASFCIVAAQLLGKSPESAQSSLSSLEVMPFRDQCLRLAGRDLHLLLAKNPTAWAELDDRLDGYVGLILVQHHTAKPQDLSWLYDLPIEALQGQRIGICGNHSLDLAVWLTYAELDWVAAADPHALAAKMPPGPLLCISDLLGAHWLVAVAQQF